MSTDQSAQGVSTEDARKTAFLLPAFEIAGLGKGVAADACNMLRSLSAERDALASRVRELEGEPETVRVPKRMTKAMSYAVEQEGWEWEDLLAAAEAITESEYTELTAPRSAQEREPDYDALEREHMGDFEKKTGIYATPTEATQPISRAEWVAQAKAVYLDAGDDPATAAECARYICNQEDWIGGEEVGDPRQAAQDDIHERPRPAATQPPAQQDAVDARPKSLNAKIADQLRPFLKPGDKVIWREAFRWHDDNGVMPNHYDGMSVAGLADEFGYRFEWDFNMNHAAIVRAALTTTSGDSHG